jgi:hypothetical protein
MTARDGCPGQCAAPLEDFLCNVSLPRRRAPKALIYDVRALRLKSDPQRGIVTGIAAGDPTCPSDYLTA